MNKVFLMLLLLPLSACVVSTGGAQKHTDGTTSAECNDVCADRTGNQAMCAEFAKSGRLSCGELIKKVCEAEEGGACGS